MALTMITNLNLSVAAADAAIANLNTNPTIGIIELTEAEWTDTDPTSIPNSACAAGDLPKVVFEPGTRMEPQEVALKIFANGNETFTTMTGSPPMATEVTEDLQMTILTTNGSTSPRFAFIEGDGEDDFEEIDWTPDEDIIPPAEGLLVKFFATARDGRNGFAWTARELCLIP